MNEKKIEELINDVFDKAKTYSISQKKNSLSSHIVEEIEKEFEISLDKVTLSRAYDKFVLKNKPNNNNPNRSTIDLLCQYLGYDNYTEYIKSKAEKNRHFKFPVKKEDKISDIESNNFTHKSSRKKVFSYGITMVLFIVISVLAFYQYTSSFNTIFNLSIKPNLKLHSDYPKLSKKDVATLKFYLPSGIKEKEIDSKNEVILADLPYGFSGEKIKTELIDKFWKLSKDSIILKSVYTVLNVEPNESLSKIDGEVLTHIGGLPIENTTIRVEDLETKTNALGMFSLTIPVEKRRIQYELSIYKEGYKSYKKIYVSGAKMQVRLLKK